MCSQKLNSILHLKVQTHGKFFPLHLWQQIIRVITLLFIFWVRYICKIKRWVLPIIFFSFQFYCDWGLCPMDHITSDSVKLETSWVWSTLTPQLQGHTVYHTAMQSKSGLVYSTLFLVCPLLRPECKWLFLGIWDWCWVRWQWPATRAHHDICCSVDSGWKTGPYLIRKLARKKRVVSVRINMVMRQELARGWNEISRGVYWYFQNGPTWQAEDITGFVLQVGYLSRLLWRSVLDGQWHGCILAVVE